jgi:hypothetical protein
VSAIVSYGRTPRFGQAHSELPSSQLIGSGNENICGRKRTREIAATGRIEPVIMLAYVEEAVDAEINRPSMKQQHYGILP